MPLQHYSVDGATAVITLDNPPVNAMGHALREETRRTSGPAWADEAVKAIVILGAGKLFCGGADVKAFGTPASRAEPSSRTIIKEIEASAKPVVAAIHGSALGLGLEFALGCHYRIVQRGAKLGLPEVKLGLLPGGGGTQRLPRVAGVEAAAKVIVEGDPVDADEAFKMGIVDEVVAGDLLPAAVEFAQRMALRPIIRWHRAVPRGRRTTRRSSRPSASGIASAKRGQPAPLEALACVAAATTMPFDEGLKFERERFDVLLNGTVSKAMRHLFLAERAAAKVTGIGAEVVPAKVASVAVIGAGTMGSGIAMSFASAGVRVALLESKQEALDRGLKTIRRNYEGTVAKGRLAQQEAEARISRIAPTLDFDVVKDADLVIEAVFEDMDVKKDLFGRFDALCKPGAVLATNTSRLDVDEIANSTRRPESVIGLHFFSPRQRDASGRGRARRGELGANHRHFDGGRARHRQAAGARRRMRRLRRQSHGLAIRARGGVLARRGRDAGAGRRRAEEFRPRDGAFRDVRSGRPRHQLGEPQASGRNAPDERALLQGRRPTLRARSVRAEDRRGLLPLRRRQPHAAARPARAGDHRRVRAGSRHRASRHRRRRDRRANDLRAGQRGRQDPRRGDRAARLRHRPDLCQWLRLSGMARRPDVLRRHGRPGQGLRARLRIRTPAWCVLEAGAAARAAGEGRGRRSPSPE
jgi:enoyl-CoA hydratase/carnithine racemase